MTVRSRWIPDWLRYQTGRKAAHEINLGRFGRSLLAAWEFILAPLVDKYVGLSLTRLLAIFAMELVREDIIRHNGTLTWVHFWTITCAISAAFGKGVFSANFLSRISLTGTGSQVIEDKTQTTHTINETIERKIIESRDAETGEPTATTPGQEPLS